MKRSRFIGTLSVALAVCVATSALISFAKVGGRAADSQRNKRLPNVIIDAGHGGFDGGAVAPDGTVEKDINLSISLKVEQYLALAGFPTVMVRSTDCSVESEGSSIRERKRSDITNRHRLMSEHSDGIYLSIHQNNYSGGRANGAQVFYRPDDLQSRLLAESLQSSLAQRVQPENKRKVKECGSSVYIIHNATSTAVLLECGFLSDYSDLHNLKDEQYQARLAFAIAAAFIENSSEG